MYAYVIYYSSYDSVGGPVPEQGIFLSWESAQARCDELNGNPRKKYAEYRLSYLRAYIDRLNAYKLEVTKHNVLREAGLVKGDYPYAKPQTREHDSFARWSRRGWNEPEYTVEGPYDVTE